MENIHIDSILELEQISFKIPWTKSMFEDEINNSLAYYVVALNDDKLLGYGGIWTIFDEGHITNIAIHPDFRRKKVATLIIEDFLRLAKEYDMNILTLEVRESNTSAQGLYPRIAA